MLTSLSDITTARRIVVKIGSALLVGGGQARAAWLTSLAAELAGLRREGAQVIVVSSGAIALGAARLGLAKGGRGSLADAQAAAAFARADRNGRNDGSLFQPDCASAGNRSGSAYGAFGGQ